MSLHLKPLSCDDSRDIYALLQTIGKDEYSFHNDVFGMSYEDYKNWLVLQAAWARGERLPENYVRQWTYWLYDDLTPVGYGKLRERVTEESRKSGGNIGYAIGADFRGKGYGIHLFGSLLKEAEALGIREIVSTVEKNNLPSLAVHRKSGLQLVGETETMMIFSKTLSSGVGQDRR